MRVAGRAGLVQTTRMLLALIACTSTPGELLDETFTDDAGVEGKVALVVPSLGDSNDALGVLLFFSWDFGNSFYKEEAELHAKVAREHGLVVASMASPRTGTDDGCWWAPRVEDNAAFVDQFVRERLVSGLGVDPERVFTTGLSGGSDFAAAFHLHTGFRYGGGAVALCGGDVPRSNGGACDPEADPEEAPSPSDLSHSDLGRVRYDFAIVADDELLENSKEAAAYYEGLGFENVRHRVVEGAGHCGFTSGWEGLDVFAEGLDYVDSQAAQD